MIKLPLRRSRRFALATATALLIAACGATDEAGERDPAAPVRAASIEVAVPDLSVADLQAGQEVPLRSVLGGDQPVLLWFWAPH